MNFVADPDVFQASFQDDTCRAVLSKIGEEFNAHKFFFDFEETLDSKYREIFNSYYYDNFDHPAIVLLQRILSETVTNEDVTISGKCTDYWDWIQELGCATPVEPTLIGMLSCARDKDITLLLTGIDKATGAKRGLHKIETVRQVGNKFPWLNILFISQTELTVPLVKYRDETYLSNTVGGISIGQPINALQFKSKEFEPRAALLLQQLIPGLTCIAPPQRSKLVKEEQIDVYGYISGSHGINTVVIGECKLRREGNEDKAVEYGEIKQLLRKIEGARCYESTGRRKPVEGGPCDFVGILISNCTDIDEAARVLAASVQNVQLRFLTLTLSTRWESRLEWSVVNSRFVELND